MANQSTTVYRAKNRASLIIREENKIGGGGEGSVYSLDEKPKLVAKIYRTDKRTDEIKSKLKFMTDSPLEDMPDDDGHVPVTWPLEALIEYPSDPDSIVGFLMQKISAWDIGQLYIPMTRKEIFPHASYRHMCAAAINVASAMESVHDRKAVIGDIKHSNILVKDDGRVTLIDADSFQVIDTRDGDNIRVYLNTVGSPEYTPPELQGKSFIDVRRGEYHDRFGLGVIIYQLLVGGWHPFYGEPNKGIKEGHFLHTQRSLQNRAVVVPDILWNTLHPEIRNLFERCFVDGHGDPSQRPSPSEWIDAIGEAVENLDACSINPQHLFSGHLSDCPWCDMLPNLELFPVYDGEPIPPRTIGQDYSSGTISEPPPATTAGDDDSAEPSSPEPPSAYSRAIERIRRIPPAVTVTSISVVAIALGALLPIAIFFGGDGGSGDNGGQPPAASNEAALPPVPGGVPPLAPTLDTPTPTPTATATPTPTPTATPTPTPSPTPTPAPTPSPTLTPTPAPTPSPTPTPPNLRLDKDSWRWTPTRPSVGDTVTFFIQVRNDGQSAAATSTLAYVIDGVANPKWAVDVPALAAGESYEATFTWVADAHPHAFELRADAFDANEETAKGDNVLSALHYMGAALPDLAIESVSWQPPNPPLGEPVTLSATVRNRGEGKAHESIIAYYVNGEPLGETTIPEMPRDGEHVVELADFPWAAEMGAHTFSAKADAAEQVAEFDEGNNAARTAYDATVYADLIVESLGWQPESPSVGETVAFTAVVRNQGTHDAAKFRVGLLLESSSGGIEFKPARLDGLAAGETATASFAWKAVEGDYTAAAHVNPTGRARENDIENNIFASASSLVAKLSDLRVGAIRWNPLRPAPGEAVTITVKVKNRGEGGALPSTLALFIDDAQDPISLDTDGIPAGGSTDATHTWAAQPGAHTFRATADYDGDVAESDETNNEKAPVSYDNTRAPDLVITDPITWTPEIPLVGESVEFTATVRNRGDYQADDFSVQFGEEGKAPMSSHPIPTLAAGASQNVTFSWTASIGERKFVAQAVGGQSVPESNVANNKSPVATFGGAGGADLEITNIEWSDNKSLGDRVTIRATVENTSAVDAEGFEVRLEIVSKDRGRVVHEDTQVVSRLSAGRSEELKFRWDAEAYKHTFTVTADYGDAIRETDESNNAKSKNYNATLLPDLRVASITFVDAQGNETDVLYKGNKIDIVAVIENRGAGDAPWRFDVALYINGDRKSDERIDELYDGRSEIVTFGWTPKGKRAYIIEVIVDPDDDMPEKRENNNIASNVVFTMNPPPPTPTPASQ